MIKCMALPQGVEIVQWTAGTPQSSLRGSRWIGGLGAQEGRVLHPLAQDIADQLPGQGLRDLGCIVLGLDALGVAYEQLHVRVAAAQS